MKFNIIDKIDVEFLKIHFRVFLVIVIITISNTSTAQRLSYGMTGQLFNIQAIKANQKYIFSDESFRIYQIEDEYQIDAFILSGYGGLSFKVDFKSLTFCIEPLIGFTRNKYSLLYPVTDNDYLECYGDYYSFDIRVPMSTSYAFPSKRKHKFYFEAGTSLSIPFWNWDLYSVYDSDKEIYAVGDKQLLKDVLYDEQIYLNSLLGFGFKTSLLAYGVRYYKRLNSINGIQQSINNLSLYVNFTLTYRKVQKHYMHLK